MGLGMRVEVRVRVRVRVIRPSDGMRVRVGGRVRLLF